MKRYTLWKASNFVQYKIIINLQKQKTKTHLWLQKAYVKHQHALQQRQDSNFSYISRSKIYKENDEQKSVQSNNIVLLDFFPHDSNYSVYIR